jgi:hypothetical protein
MWAKFTKRGMIRLEAGRDGDAAMFGIVDSGIGMTPEQTQMIFERFTRVHSDSGPGGAFHYTAPLRNDGRCGECRKRTGQRLNVHDSAAFTEPTYFQAPSSFLSETISPT